MMKISKEEQDRRTAIDAVRGTAVFLVLWGHCIQFSSAGSHDFYGDMIFKLIYSFHMPLFALVSGYLFFDSLAKRTLKQSAGSKITGLLWPLLLWSTVRSILDILLYLLKNEPVHLMQVWWDSFTGMFLWFLWSILAISVCIAVTVKLLPEKLHVLGIVGCYFVMYLFPNEEMNLYLYPYFVIGYYARKREQEWKTCRRQGLWIAALFFSAMLFFFRDSCYIYASGITLWTSEHGWMTQLGIDLYRYAIGLAGSIVAMELAVRGVKRLPAVVTGAVTDCGKLSMQIYILQCFCLSWAWPKIWRKIVQSLGFHPLTGNLLLYWSITLAMAAAFMIILSAVIKSVKRRPQVHRFLFGR